MQIDYQHYFELARAFIYSIGGPTLIIVGLSKLIGDHLSKSRLEHLQNEHNLELERTKSQLEQTKSQFLRYSEKQFDLYNNLWLVLNRTRELADSLWEKAERSMLTGFAEQIRQTRRAITDNMLLIEDSHYRDLDELLGEFEQFEFGKQKLVEMRTEDINRPVSISASDAEVKSAIQANKKVRDKYTKLIMKIGRSLRKQIRG